MIIAPRANRATAFRSGVPGVAKAMLHQHGNNNNQVPIGLSNRARYRYGCSHTGAHLSIHVRMSKSLFALLFIVVIKKSNPSLARLPLPLMIGSMKDKKTKARLFVNEALRATAKITATSHQAHYLLKVLRAENGDRVVLFNGYDGEWTSVINDVSKKRCAFRVEKQLREQQVEPDLWLAFAPLKKSNTDFVIEKASELGASRLIPVFTEHTNSTRVKFERLRVIAMEAAEQCDRLSVAQVTEPVTFTELIDQWPEQRSLLVPDETGGGESLKSVLDADQKSLHGLLIGPEGGFARSELDVLGNLPFVTLVGLGPRILRTETAAIAALACYQAIIGDWDQRPRFKNGYFFNANK